MSYVWRRYEPAELYHRATPPDPPDLMDRAVAAARGCEAAVVVVHSPPAWETEGRDRPSMRLTGAQDELVERVAAANPRTVVVLNTGSPHAMPWADKVSAIVQRWFPGQEMGRVLAKVGFTETGRKEEHPVYGTTLFATRRL